MAFFQTGPVRLQTGRLDRLDTEPDRFGTEPDRFGTKPAGSVTNRSPIQLTDRFDPVWFQIGEPAGSDSGLDDF